MHGEGRKPMSSVSSINSSLTSSLLSSLQSSASASSTGTSSDPTGTAADIVSLLRRLLVEFKQFSL